MSGNTKENKILLVTNDGFSSLNGGAILNRNLFKAYEAGNLLSLDSSEQDFIPSLVKRISLIPHALGLGFRKHSDSLKSVGAAGSRSYGTRSLLQRITRLLLGDASQPTFPFKLWALHRKVKDFAPDVIYTTMGSYAVHKIVLYLSKKMRIPVVIHIMDDWIVAKNNYGLLSLLQGWLIRRTFADLLRVSSTRYVISEGMKLAYEQRYGYRFNVLGNVVEDTWINKGDIRESRDVLSIGYVGSFTDISQREPIEDVVNAIAALNRSDGECKFKLSLFATPATYVYATKCFAGHADVEVGVAPVDDIDFYNLLRGFDLLLLPSSFTGHSREYIKYSVPAKFYSYLAAGVVVLYYGDSASEQIRLASQNGLGLVVTDRSPSVIQEALRRFSKDRAGAQGCLERQYDYIKKNHDANLIRRSLYRSLDECIYSKAIVNQTETGRGYDHYLLEKKRKLIDAVIEKTKPKSVLDFGGGTGYTFSRYINEHHPDIDITLFDVSVESIEAASWQGQRIEKVSDPKSLEARQFDLVIASEVVEHVDASDFILKDIAELVKQDGYLFATVPNGYGSYEITVLLYRLFVKPIVSKLSVSGRRGQAASTLSPSPHVAFYTYPTLMSGFKCAGLVVENYLPIVLSHFRAARMLSAYLPWAMRMNVDVTPQLNPRWVDDWGFLLTRSEAAKSTGCQRQQELKLLTCFNVFRAKMNRRQAS
jgi:2-polyprenyl-3-methyl-5-hydroxy-6-metoxy-1,4-benzoquinol methylase